MERKERFYMAFEHLRMTGVIRTQKSLADALGASAPHISSALKGDEKYLTDNLLMRFCTKFPMFRLKWLLNGEGEMLVGQESASLNDMKEERKESLFSTEKISRSIMPEERPHYIALAKAGLPTTEQDGSYEMQPVITQLPRYDYTVEVRGDSMAPEYKSGDTIACLDVTKSSYIQWGRVHLLNTAQGVMLKKIYDNEDSIRCVSINSDEYPEFFIPKSEIYTVGLVVGSLRIS